MAKNNDPPVVMGYWTYLLLRVLPQKGKFFWHRYAGRLAKGVLFGFLIVFGLLVVAEVVAIALSEVTLARQMDWDLEFLPRCLEESRDRAENQTLNTEEPSPSPTNKYDRALGVMACPDSAPPRPQQYKFVSIVEDFNDLVFSTSFTSLL